MALSTVSLYSWDLEDVFSVASEAGFRLLEVMVDRRPQSQDAEALKLLCKEYGLEIYSIHAPFLLAYRKIWGKPLEKIERSLDMARVLGSKLVVLHLPYFWQVDFARWLYHNLNAYNRNGRPLLAVENAIFLNLGKRINLSFFNDLKELARFESIVLDTSHLAVGEVDIFLAWRELGERIRHIHLSNNYLKGFDDHELPQKGKLPLDRFLATLAKEGYPYCLALELSPGSLGERFGRDEVVARLKETIQFCQEHFQ